MVGEDLVVVVIVAAKVGKLFCLVILHKGDLPDLSTESVLISYLWVFASHLVVKPKQCIFGHFYFLFYPLVMNLYCRTSHRILVLTSHLHFISVIFTEKLYRQASLVGLPRLMKSIEETCKNFQSIQCFLR